MPRSPQQVDALFWQPGFSDDCDAGRYPDADATARRSGISAATRVAMTSSTRPGAASSRTTDISRRTRLHSEAFAPFDDQFFCHRLTANKPDEAVYRQVAELLGVPIEAIRFVDDGSENVEAAPRCGWTAAEYQSPADITALLKHAIADLSERLRRRDRVRALIGQDHDQPATSRAMTGECRRPYVGTRHVGTRRRRKNSLSSRSVS
jgi:hypothetical protein